MVTPRGLIGPKRGTGDLVNLGSLVMIFESFVCDTAGEDFLNIFEEDKHIGANAQTVEYSNFKNEGQMSRESLDAESRKCIRNITITSILVSQLFR